MTIYICTQKRYDQLADDYGTKMKACKALNQSGSILPELTDIKVHQSGRGHRLPRLSKQEARKELKYE